MRAVEVAVAAAANLVGPFSEKDDMQNASSVSIMDAGELVRKALWHIEAINAADLTTDPAAPYDTSLVGIVYGLLDIITLHGIIPQLSSGLAFSQRPKSFLSIPIGQQPGPCRDGIPLPNIVQSILSILGQRNSGVQPLLLQRSLPDIITALAELAFSPGSDLNTRSGFSRAFYDLISKTPTSRLLPIMTTLLQQDLPSWIKPVLSWELSIIPLRVQGIRHLVEFLSLSYLNKFSQLPQNVTGPQSPIPVPVEAIVHVSQLLALPPRGQSQAEWLRKLAPQLLSLLDGEAGKELVWAAGRIISTGLLSKKSTGAPGSIGWELFALPLLNRIYPKGLKPKATQGGLEDGVIVQELDLIIALKRLSAIVSSCSQAGLLKRLVGPLILPLWALVNFATNRPSLGKEWAALPHTILTKYIRIVGGAKRIDIICSNISWDGDVTWAFGPGSHGGVEIRQRSEVTVGLSTVDSTISRIGYLNIRTELFTSLLTDANIPSELAGAIFLQVTRRWLFPAENDKMNLTGEYKVDPLAALVDAKLSETLSDKLREKLARIPRHVVELMGQLIQNAVSCYKLRGREAIETRAPSRTMLGKIVKRQDKKLVATNEADGETVEDDLTTYALSVLSTLITSPGFKPTPETISSLHAIIPSLKYLEQPQDTLNIPPLVRNSAASLLHLIGPLKLVVASHTSPTKDVLGQYRTILTAALSDLQSPDPPSRAWALDTLHTLIRNSTAFPVVDVPSLTHMLLSVSLADWESYVHTAAVPVILSLAVRAPRIVIKIVTDAFLDINEASLGIAMPKHMSQNTRVLQEALEFRLRVGEVLNNIVLEDEFWLGPHGDATTRYQSVRCIVDACMALASRRGQRNQTSSARAELMATERRLQEESEAAWDGPIPNVLEPEGRDANEQAEIDALSTILREWESTGLDEDVRIRTSALSVLSILLEHRLRLVDQLMAEASLQLVLNVLTMETSKAKAILRRASLLVLLGLIRSLDRMVGNGEESAVYLKVTEEQQIEKVVRWIQDEDVDSLVREHAAAVVDGLETLRTKRLIRMRDARLRMGTNLELQGSLRGLYLTPGAGNDTEKKLILVEQMD